MMSHGFDNDAWRLRAEAQTQQESWEAWCTPLIESIHRINDLAEDNAPGSFHPLSRPGLYFSDRKYWFEKHHVTVQLAGEQLAFDHDRREGVYLHGYVRRPHGTSSVSAYLEKPWETQSTLLKEHWLDVFGNMGPVLAQVESALVSGLPLDGGNWSSILAAQLKDDNVPSDFIRGWTNNWGSGAMREALAVVDGLFDMNRDWKQWREQLALAWSAPSVTEAFELPSFVQDTESPVL